MGISCDWSIYRHVFSRFFLIAIAEVRIVILPVMLVDVGVEVVVGTSVDIVVEVVVGTSVDVVVEVVLVGTSVDIVVEVVLVGTSVVVSVLSSESKALEKVIKQYLMYLLEVLEFNVVEIEKIVYLKHI